MDILTVKENWQGGFLVNGTINVPNANGNRHYALVQEWIANGGVVEPFETQAEIDARVLQESLQTNNLNYEAQVQSLTKDYPNSEIITWTKQEAEARAWILDNTYPTPFIDVLSTSRGVSKSVLVDKIISKADAFNVALGQLTGERQAEEDRILGVV